MNRVIFASASEWARRIRAREISAAEAVEMHLSRIDEVNPSLNAVVTRCDDLAFERAKEADAALTKGKPVRRLHGVPITVKDAFDTAGVRSTGGTKGRADHIPSTNATAVKRLLAAGAILIGKTNTPARTLFCDTDSLLFGETFNPCDASLSPRVAAASVRRPSSPPAALHWIWAATPEAAYGCPHTFAASRV